MCAKILSPNSQMTNYSTASYHHHASSYPWDPSSTAKRNGPFRANFFWSRPKFGLFSESSDQRSPSPPDHSNHFASKYFSQLKSKIAQRYTALTCKQQQSQFGGGGVKIVTAAEQQTNVVQRHYRSQGQTENVYEAAAQITTQRSIAPVSHCNRNKRQTPRSLDVSNAVLDENYLKHNDNVSSNIVMRITEPRSYARPNCVSKDVHSDGGDSFIVVPITKSPILEARLAGRMEANGSCENRSGGAGKRKSFKTPPLFSSSPCPKTSAKSQSRRRFHANNDQFNYEKLDFFDERSAPTFPHPPPSAPFFYARRTFQNAFASSFFTGRGSTFTQYAAEKSSFRVVPITYDESFYRPRCSIPIVVEPSSSPSEAESNADPPPKLSNNQHTGGVKIEEITSTPAKIVASQNSSINASQSMRWGETSSFSDFNFSSNLKGSNVRSRRNQHRVVTRNKKKSTTALYPYRRSSSIRRLIDKYPTLGRCWIGGSNDPDASSTHLSIPESMMKPQGGPMEFSSISSSLSSPLALDSDDEGETSSSDSSQTDTSTLKPMCQNDLSRKSIPKKCERTSYENGETNCDRSPPVFLYVTVRIKPAPSP